MEHKDIKIVKAVKELFKAFGYFVDNLWHVKDIHFICEQNNIMRLSDQEAMEIFEIANEQCGGGKGLSLPDLEKAVHIYLQRKTTLIDPRRKDGSE